MRASLTVARREVRALLDTPAGYVLLTVFLIVNAFLFFRQAYLTNTASLRPMLDLLPWLFLFFVPAVAMRTLAEDTRSGQLEVLLSQPLTEFELLLGKYFGATFFLWLALLATVPIPVGLSLASESSWGPVVAQYIGAMLFAAGLAGVGVWASCITRSQITAFIVAVGVMFLLVLVGLNPLVVGLPPQLGAVAARLGVLSHFDSIGRGVVDLRDVIYFVSLAAVFLALAFGTLLGRRLAQGQAPARRLRLGVLLMVATLVVVNLLGGYIGGRLDLTPGRLYTLSEGSRSLARSLDDLVTIKVFASKELPAEVALLERDLADLLRDLRAAGGGRIRIVQSDPGDDAEARREARTLGVTPVQFNVVGRSELQVKEGYFGLVIQYADQTHPIPVIQRTDDLEYRIAAAIRSLTRKSKPVIGLVVAMDDWGREGRTLGLVQQELSRSYTVVPVSLDDPANLADSIRTIIVAGQPDSLVPAVRERFAEFFRSGGSALIMTTGAPVDGRTPQVSAREPAWNELLAPFRVKIRPDLVYDLAANQIVPMPGEGGAQVLRPYPLWLRARAVPGTIVTDGVGEVSLLWSSSIDTLPGQGGLITPLLLSSRAAGVAEGMIDLDPTRFFPETDLRSRPLAVMVQPADADTGRARGRLVLVGNMEFATDRYASSAAENGIFVLNAIDWLAQDEALIGIRSRDRRPPRLVFTSPALQQGIKYANVAGIPLLIAVGGFIHLVRRRRRSRTPWQTQDEPAGGAA
ncbi:MAG: Gldg family protein [Gemmatimonadota bacterium]|nr:Gldg family protein [Gemmatimonadota bacterium]